MNKFELLIAEGLGEQRDRCFLSSRCMGPEACPPLPLQGILCVVEELSFEKFDAASMWP